MTKENDIINKIKNIGVIKIVKKDNPMSKFIEEKIKKD